MTNAALPSFIALRPMDREKGYTFLVQPYHCVGPEHSMFLFGGTTLAVGITALETTCERPIVWASAQYLGPAHPGDELRLTVEVLREGKGITLAETLVTSGSGPVATISAALGAGRENDRQQWRQAPDVPSPHELPVGQHRRMNHGLHAEMEIRVAQGRYGMGRVGRPEESGRLVFWIRTKRHRIEKSLLAVLADFVPGGVGNALGMNSGGRSLDNTLRWVAWAPTDWVLADISISAVAEGLAHGDIALFAEDGTLLALGSQTLVVVHHDRQEQA